MFIPVSADMAETEALGYTSRKWLWHDFQDKKNFPKTKKDIVHSTGSGNEAHSHAEILTFSTMFGKLQNWIWHPQKWKGKEIVFNDFILTVARKHCGHFDSWYLITNWTD